ncbi:hypothetical protein RQP46_005978 [Phenoliferia psychrophenolica]
MALIHLTSGWTLKLLLAAVQVAAIWPAPRVQLEGSTPVVLSPAFEIIFAPPSNLCPDLSAAITRTNSYLLNDHFSRVVVGRGSGDRALLHGAHSLDRLELALSPSNASAAPSSLLVEVNKAYEDLDEAYTLEIPGEVVGDVEGPVGADKSARITATSELGLLRGLQTFVQLVYSLPGGVDSSDETEVPLGHFAAPPALRYILNTPLKIVDSPAFPHRGFMLDTSRSYYPIKDIERTLEVMSWAKLNVFHWHVTDAQSWPLVIPTHPKLSERGAYSPDQVYSPADVAHLEEYAASLGIRIMLEVDVPGHTASVAEAYPEMVVCAFLESWTGFGNEPPTGQLKLGDPVVQTFAEDVSTFAAGLVGSRYFSTGGDEINSRCYLEDPTMDPTTVASPDALNAALSTFVTGVHDALRKIDKVPVVWEEMVLAHDIALENDTIVMVWISSANVNSVALEGYRIIHAASDFFYLDCGAGGWLGNSSSLNSWCSYNTWSKSYSFDPYANLTAEQRPLILGGQALLWSEQADPNNLDSIAW